MELKSSRLMVALLWFLVRKGEAPKIDGCSLRGRNQRAITRITVFSFFSACRFLVVRKTESALSQLRNPPLPSLSITWVTVTSHLTSGNSFGTKDGSNSSSSTQYQLTNPLVCLCALFIAVHLFCARLHFLVGGLFLFFATLILVVTRLSRWS